VDPLVERLMCSDPVFENVVNKMTLSQGEWPWIQKRKLRHVDF
jgi:hypothetical protein